jgi:beta-N-acetylhexosaminidase
MKQIGPKFSEVQQQNDKNEAGMDDTLKLASTKSKRATSTNQLEHTVTDPMEHTVTDPVENTAVAENLGNVTSETSAMVEAQALLDDFPSVGADLSCPSPIYRPEELTVVEGVPVEENIPTEVSISPEVISDQEKCLIASYDTDHLATFHVSDFLVNDSPDVIKMRDTATDGKLEADINHDKVVTHRLPSVSLPPDEPLVSLGTAQQGTISRGKALLLTIILLTVIFNAANLGSSQFIGTQGWAFVLSGSTNTSDPNLLQDVAVQFRHTPTPGSTEQTTPQVTPEEYINAIVNRMPLDEKLGQMMIVQFYNPDYGLDISTMISQYKVGAVLIFSANNNIVSKPQLKDLVHQMQKNSTVPLVVAIDQEGGTVDRLIKLDGPRPSATSIGMTNNPSKAMAAGIQDAKDLSYYGFNLNFAPVVDVTNVYNPQLYLRTFGNNSTIVTRMAGAYLRGLQESGKVVGALKHFPGLGDVSADPHISVPSLYRTKSALSAIDWAPYRTLIAQGDVQAVMVTHEIVTNIDNTQPSSLSYKIVTGILRNQLGFHGVIVTDSLTMEGIIAYYTEAQAAAMAVEAGCDLLMGASTPAGVADMINGIKQAISDGNISQQRIDDSVRRILMLKYQMGLLKIPKV